MAVECVVPVVYADDIGAIEIIGSRVRITLVEFRRIGGEIIRDPVLEVIRPLESLSVATLRLLHALGREQSDETGLAAH